jgi:hypothetical protein
MSQLTTTTKSASHQTMLGDVEGAATELLRFQKEGLLATQQAMGVLFVLGGPHESTLLGPSFGENIAQMARKAATWAAELQATRVVGTCAGWLVPKDLPGTPGSRKRRQAHFRGRKPAVMAFCVDHVEGAALVVAQGVSTTGGKVIGFREPEAGLVPEFPGKALAGIVARGLLLPGTVRAENARLAGPGGTPRFGPVSG